MKKIIFYANEYLRQSDWTDLALIKFCLASIGLLMGLSVPKKIRKPVILVATAVFIATYIPLILKLIVIIVEDQTKD